MKQIKRLLSGLLTLLLALSCFAGLSLPVSAEDVTTSSPYGLYIGGNPVTAENKDNFKGDSKVSIRFDPETTTLYLNGASVTSAGTIYVPDYYNGGTKPISGAILYTAGGTLTIELTGTNSFGSTKTPGDYGIYSYGSLTVNGAERSRLNAFGTVGLYINGNRTYTQNGGIVTATGVGNNGFVNNHYDNAVVMNGGELDAIVIGTPEDSTKGIALNVPNGKICINNDAKVYGSTSLQGARGIYGGNGIYPSGRHWVLSGKKNAVQLRAEAALIGTGPVPIYYCQFDEDMTVASTVYITPRDLHDITVTAEHGTITLDTDQGYFMQQIKILVWTPDPGYRLRAIHIKDVEAGETFDIDLNVTTYNPDYSSNVYYAFTMPDGRCEVTGDFVPERFTVTFDPLDGSGSMDAQQTEITDDDVIGTFTLPETCGFTPPAGGDFAWSGKWFVGAHDDTQYDGGSEIRLSADTTVYPVWQHTHDGRTFTVWRHADHMPDTKGNYYLACDVALSEPWTVATGGAYPIEVCLNGYSIRQTAENSPVIRVGGNWAEAYSTDDLGILFVHDHTGNGTITGGTDGGVEVVKGAFYLTGGSITGNSTAGNGGGVRVLTGAGMAGLNGCMLSGGSVTGNVAGGNGGGVYAEGDVLFENVSVTGNEAGGLGGGVYAADGVGISGVSSGTGMTGSCTPTVAGNTAAGAASDLWLAAGQKFSFGGNTLEPGSRIGICTEIAPTVDAPVIFTKDMPAGSEQYFFSDNESYGVMADTSGQAVLYVADVIRFLPGRGSGTMPVGHALPDGSYTLPANGFTAPAGEHFVGWLVGSDPDWKAAGDTITVTGETTLTALWTDTHNGVTFQPWLYSDRLPDTAGDWYLMSDVTLTAQWVAPTGATRLCLNGKTVTQSGVTTSGIQVPSSAALQVYDHTGAGTITGFDATGNGGAVYNEGTFALFGGAITGNRSNGDGGAIYSSGSVAIHGGSITNNTARLSGGAISAHAGEIAVLGGEISGNTATTAHGGAIYFANSAKLDLRGGTITGNTAGNQGGGILANNTTQRSFTVRGSVVVTGNTGGNGDNIYLRPNNYITVADNLDQSANLGITTETRPSLGSPVTITSGLSGKGDTSVFRCDNADYILALQGGEAVLGLPYTVQFAAGGGSGDMEPVSTLDASLTLPACTFAAPKDRHFDHWQDVGGNEYAAGDSFTFSASTANYTLTAIWELDDHTITVPDWNHGRVTATPNPAKAGDTVTLTYSYETGYELAALTVVDEDGTEIPVTDNRFTMPASDVTVEVTFTEINYSISIAETENGSVTAPATAHLGDTVTLTVTPDPYYELKSLKYTEENGDWYTVTNNQFIMPDCSVTVTAVFGRITYAVTVSSTEHGRVTASAYDVPENDTVTLSIEADAGYTLGTLTVTDEENNVIAVTNGQFTMPGRPVTVTATFEPIDYTVTVAETQHGTVTADKTGNVHVGEQVTLTVEPEDRYFLKTLTVTDGSGNEIDVTNNTFTMPAGNVTVNATFATVTYTVTTDVPHGSIEISHEAAAEDETVTFTVTPDAGYLLNGVTVTDADNHELTVTNGSFTMPAANVTVTAAFTAIDYTVTVNVTGRGTASANKTTGVHVGDSVSLFYEPADGFRCTGLTAVDADGNDVPVSFGAFTMPASNVTVNVKFQGTISTSSANESALYGVYTYINGKYDRNINYADPGDAIEIRAYLRPGYDADFTAVTVGGTSSGTNIPFTTEQMTDGGILVMKCCFSMPEGSGVQVTVNTVAGTRTVTLADSYVGGTVAFADDPTVRTKTFTVGEQVRLIVTPNEGYQLKNRSYTYKTSGGSMIEQLQPASGESYNYYFTMPANDAAVDVSFAAIRTLTVTASGNGQVTGSHIDGTTRDGTVTGSVTAGTWIRIEAKPDWGTYSAAYYDLGSVSITCNGEPVNIVSQSDSNFSTQGSYTYYFYMPDGDAEVRVNFVFAGRVLTAETSHGSVQISPNNGWDIKAGQTVTVNATPESGYRLSEIHYCTAEMNGYKINETGDPVAITEQDASGNPTFTMPSAPVYVHTTFAQKAYAVTVDSGVTGGQLNASTPFADEGETVTLTATPDDGFELDTLTATAENGETVTVDRDGQFVMPASSVTVAATFKRAASFAGHSLSLMGDIGVNFYLDLNGGSTENLSVVFTWGEGNEKTVQLSELTAIADGDYAGCYKLTANVAAKEMTDTITATIYSGETVLATDRYSVKAYCTAILGDSSYGEALQALVRNMLIYGAKAQLQFNYNTDSLADADLGSASQAGIDTSTLGSYGTADLSAFGLNFLASSLVLESKTSHKLYFTVNDETALAATTITCGSLTLERGTDTNGFYVIIPNMAARNVLKNYTLTLTKAGATTKFKVNAGAYIAIVLDDTLSSDSLGLTDEQRSTLKNTVTALYWYSTAAEAYFSAN